MSLLQQAPRFGTAAAVQLARDVYGVVGEAAPLPSERDQNFLLTTSTNRFVLKIANASEDRELLEAQNAIMAHLSPLNLCPRVVPATSGESIAQTGGGHLVRLLTWVPGSPLGAVDRQPDALLEHLGARLGELDRALTAFDHPAVHRDFHWDLAQGFRVIASHSHAIPDAAFRGLVERIAAHVHARDGQTLERLRQSVIHADVNDYNVLVEGERVSGIVDFGDCVHSYTVGDPAIAIAYAVLDKPNPLHTMEVIARGYHAQQPLTDDEVRALFGLVQLRLCVSVCMAAHQQPQRPSDEYLGVSQAPIRRTLPRLAAIHPDVAEERLREACGMRRGPYVRQVPKAATLGRRQALLGSNLSIGYRDPLKLSHGWMQYLFDDDGRRCLDAYNNVPHVGHSHPRVVAAVHEQLRSLNTNTRYLYDSLWQFAEQLCLTLPKPLQVCYFVNSGSEANELALRLARARTGHRDVIVQDAAYHGNTTTLIDISPYKFNGPGGQGKAPWVHVVPVPDDYRGAYKRSDADAGVKYAAAVAQVVDDLRSRDVGLGAFIAETCPSVGGQIIPPSGYLEAVYRVVRDAGGVCIADEVQTAYGRIGTHFYAFEAQGVVPDIVVLGKPIGNGYPLGAVVTTPEIARSFDNGMEFFSTFGGSTVSCAAGLAVLEVMREEQLQAHANRVGEQLRAGLRSLMERHAIVGDVRGSGLFFGVELVKDRATLEPAADAASFVVNRLREEGILIGTDGPFHNVLKLRGPMPFDEGDGEHLIATLDAALGELANQPSLPSL